MGSKIRRITVRGLHLSRNRLFTFFAVTRSTRCILITPFCTFRTSTNEASRAGGCKIDRKSSQLCKRLRLYLQKVTPHALLLSYPSSSHGLELCTARRAPRACAAVSLNLGPRFLRFFFVLSARRCDSVSRLGKHQIGEASIHFH